MPSRDFQTTAAWVLGAILAFGAGASTAEAKGKGTSAGKRAARTATEGPVDRTKIPDGGPAPKRSLPKPERFVLSTGTRVVVVERHELPMASVAVVWARGAGDELPSEAGVASLTAGLLDEGTAKHGALELAEAVDRIGAHLAVGASWDATFVSLESLRRHLDTGLGLLAEVVSQPAFAEPEIERVKAEALTAMMQRKDQATALASDVLGRVLYGDRRYGLPSSGNEQTLRALGRANVVAWYERELRPENATIIVAGDITVAEAKERLERAFAGWRAPPAPAAVTHPTDAPLPAARRVLVDKPNAPQSELRIALPSVPRSTADYFPLLVMNEILGGGDFSNRINLNLREAHAYTYGAHSAFAFRREGGPFVVASAVKTDVTGPAAGEAFGEILRIRSATVDPGELRQARDGLERAMARRFASLSDVTGEIAAQIIYGLPDDYFATFASKVEAVTIDDVRRVAEKHLDPARMSFVVVGDRAKVSAQLGELPFGAFTDVDADAKPVAAAAVPTPAAQPAKAAAPKR